jgi:hypothetical protein
MLNTIGPWLDHLRTFFLSFFVCSEWKNHNDVSFSFLVRFKAPLDLDHLSRYKKTFLALHKKKRRRRRWKRGSEKLWCHHHQHQWCSNSGGSSRLQVSLLNNLQLENRRRTRKRVSWLKQIFWNFFRINHSEF